MSGAKELDYFVAEKAWSRGEDWYRSNFAEPNTIMGESSPNYTKHPRFSGVAKRMHELIPDAQLIYLVREPVQRLVSHYFHQVLAGQEDRNLEEVCEALINNHYVNCSRYGFQLSQFLEYFDREKILILKTSDLEANPDATMRDIFTFLGVDAAFKHVTFGKRHHVSADRRRVNKLGQWLLKIPSGLRLATLIGLSVSEEMAKPMTSESTSGCSPSRPGKVFQTQQSTATNQTSFSRLISMPTVHR